MGGTSKSQNINDCLWYNKVGTPNEKNEGTDKPPTTEMVPKDANFAQIVWTELKRALCTKLSRCYCNTAFMSQKAMMSLG